MKKIVFAILAIVVIAALILVLPVSKENTRETESYLRIHIRANSNSDADQELKYKVKQAVVDFMTPLLVNADTKERAVAIVRSNFDGIERTADAVIKANGFDYASRASIKREDFPTRSYGEFTLESGVYDTRTRFGKGRQLVVRRLSAAVLCKRLGQRLGRNSLSLSFKRNNRKIQVEGRLIHKNGVFPKTKSKNSFCYKEEKREQPKV